MYCNQYLCDAHVNLVFIFKYNLHLFRLMCTIMILLSSILFSHRYKRELLKITLIIKKTWSSYKKQI